MVFKSVWKTTSGPALSHHPDLYPSLLCFSSSPSVFLSVSVFMWGNEFILRPRDNTSSFLYSPRSESQAERRWKTSQSPLLSVQNKQLWFGVSVCMCELANQACGVLTGFQQPAVRWRMQISSCRERQRETVTAPPVSLWTDGLIEYMVN